MAKIEYSTCLVLSREDYKKHTDGALTMYGITTYPGFPVIIPFLDGEDLSAELRACPEACVMRLERRFADGKWMDEDRI